jgi:hypothetical protein
VADVRRGVDVVDRRSEVVFAHLVSRGFSQWGQPADFGAPVRTGVILIFRNR